MPTPLLGFVMVVDDEPDDIFLLQRTFIQAGLTLPVQTFSSAEYAEMFLRGIITNRGALPSIVFIDLAMPGMGGFGLLKWIRSEPAACGVRCVINSSSAREEDVLRAKALGAGAFLTKHASVAELQRVMAGEAVFPNGAYRA